MKKWITTFITLVFIVGSIILYIHNQSQGSASPTIPVTQVTPTPTPERIGDPILLTIPKFNVSANVESVGMDSLGRMDIPKNFENVAWYNLGFKPGQKGSAVIDGHVDTPTGAPAVFANIANLQPGDIITVEDSYNKTHSFTVTQITKYPYDQLPLQTIFNSTDKSRLNLITCAGVWDRVHKNYSERTVVFAEKE